MPGTISNAHALRSSRGHILLPSGTLRPQLPPSRTALYSYATLFARAVPKPPLRFMLNLRAHYR